MASRCQCLQVLRQTFALYPPSRLCNYLGQHYTYDARGNLLERLDNGKKARFTWDLYDRLTRYEDDRLTADFAWSTVARETATILAAAKRRVRTPYARPHVVERPLPERDSS